MELKPRQQIIKIALIATLVSNIIKDIRQKNKGNENINSFKIGIFKKYS